MRLTLDIPDELHARLKALAKREGTTMRAIVLRAIERELRTPTIRMRTGKKSHGPGRRSGIAVDS